MKLILARYSITALFSIVSTVTGLNNDRQNGLHGPILSIVNWHVFIEQQIKETVNMYSRAYTANIYCGFV